MSASTSAVEFREAFKRSTNIVAIAGAGLSAASGIPTFRDVGGYWKTVDVMSIATPKAFEANPSLVWQFYHSRRASALRAEPNPAHMALAVLCIPDLLHVIAPQAKFTLITQNVDSLSTRALHEVQQKRDDLCSQVSPVLEMHGRLNDTICTICNRRETNLDKSLCPALAMCELSTEDNAHDGQKIEIPIEDLPHCHHCGGLLRPGVVWFEETPYRLKEVWEAVDQADMCLVIGTSSTVQPAAGFAYEVSERGGKIAIFNLQHSEGDEKADFLFLGPCEHTLPKVLLSSDV